MGDWYVKRERGTLLDTIYEERTWENRHGSLWDVGGWWGWA